MGIEFVPEADVASLGLEATSLDLEVAMVSVIWPEGSHHPTIDYVGCSGFEAAALLRGALKRLEKANAKCMVFLEESQEYEDIEEEDDDA